MELCKLRDGILDGVIAGADEYCSWSLGNAISDYGTEAAMNVFIARSIYRRFSEEGVAVTLEEDFGRVGGFAGIATPPDFSARRVDVAIYRSADKTRPGLKPIAVIETKRNARDALAPADVSKVARAVVIYNLQAGYFVSIELPFHSGKEGVQNLMSKRTDDFLKVAPGMMVKPFWRWDESCLSDFAPPLGQRLIVPLLFEIRPGS